MKTILTLIVTLFVTSTDIYSFDTTQIIFHFHGPTNHARIGSILEVSEISTMMDLMTSLYHPVIHLVLTSFMVLTQ